jgi:hypothetical protein
MAFMEFLKQNFLDTTTMVKVNSNTGTAQYLFDRNPNLTYASVGYNSITSTVISIELDANTVISHLLFQNHNFKQFRVFYNSVTANTLSPDINVTQNSATSSYFSFTSITVNSIQIQVDTTIAGSTDKQIGELIVTERVLQFERNPTANEWRPAIRRKQIVHEMPDGGVKVYHIRDKFKAKIGFDFITETFHNNLKNVFEDAEPRIFVPFPTATSWDGTAPETAWIGDFNFRHGDNAKDAGYSGDIDLRETAGG